MSPLRRFRRALARFLGPRPHPWLRAGIVASTSAAALSACMSHISPRWRLDETVQETNVAARFGRNDIAMEHVAGKSRDGFVKRHRLWGSEVRIVDVEFAGTEKSGPKESVVLVGFSWFRPGEGTLRATVVRQTWKNDDGSGPWFLVDEERASGDVGLLGEPPVAVLSPARPTTHFATTVIKEK